MPSYNLTAAQTPTPLPQATAAIGNGASGTFTSGMSAGFVAALNQIEAVLKRVGGWGGGAYATLGAPGDGIDVSATIGLNVTISAGVAFIGQLLEFVASGAVAPYQQNISAAYTLPDNSTSYLWMTATGSLASTTVRATPPAGARLFLATVTTLSGAVSNIDYSGRVYLNSGVYYRITADTGAPTDAPPAGMALQTVTPTAAYQWVSNGALAYHATQPNPATAGALYKQAGAGTPVTATAGETQGAVANIPANTIKGGTYLRLSYWGRITGFHIGDNVQVRIRFGATTLTGTVIAGGGSGDDVSNVGGMAFKGEVLLAGYAAPSASSAVVGASEYFNPSQLLTTVAKESESMGPTNFATDANLLIEATIQFSSANASNSGVVDGFLLEAI